MPRAVKTHARAAMSPPVITQDWAAVWAMGMAMELNRPRPKPSRAQTCQAPPRFQPMMMTMHAPKQTSSVGMLNKKVRR